MELLPFVTKLHRRFGVLSIVVEHMISDRVPTDSVRAVCCEAVGGQDARNGRSACGVGVRAIHEAMRDGCVSAGETPKSAMHAMKMARGKTKTESVEQ